MLETQQNMGLSRPVSNMAKPACINDAMKQQQRIQIVSKELWISLSWPCCCAGTPPSLINTANTDGFLVVWPTELSNVLPCMFNGTLGTLNHLAQACRNSATCIANQLFQLLLQAQVWQGVEVRAAALDIPNLQNARAESACLIWPTCPVLSNLPPPKWFHSDSIATPLSWNVQTYLSLCTSLFFVSWRECGLNIKVYDVATSCVFRCFLSIPKVSTKTHCRGWMQLNNSVFAGMD